jgi:carbamoyl-phosphate synthase small subunit
LKAYIVRDRCQEPSNFRCEGDLDTFLKKEGIVGIYGIDTRALTKIVREYGVMNGKVVTEGTGSGFGLSELKNYTIKDAVMNTTCTEEHTETPMNVKRKVVLWDFGAKANIERELLNRGCEVTVIPAGTKAERIFELNPDGIMLSNGPGDPAENTACIAEIKKLLGNVPMFGICLGHQLLALAAGGATEKLKYGHRGANQPCKDLVTGHTYITSQNHGYAVVSDSLATGRIRFVNANDQTCEGVEYPEYRAFTVQFHPEACAGPMDTSFLFDKFADLMGER